MVAQRHTEGGMAEVDNLRWKYINDLKYKFKKNCFTDLVGSSFVCAQHGQQLDGESPLWAW